MNDYAVIIAARLNSARLPGKVLAPYGKERATNLEQIVGRWRASRRAPEIVVATGNESINDPIAELCQRLGLACHRDALPSALERMDGALLAYVPQARWIARGMADNPLVDVELADWRIDLLHESGADGLHYGGDHARITYAGTTDVWSREMWERIAEHSSGSQREHPGAYYWDNLSKFRTLRLPFPAREFLLGFRTELDTDEDLKMFQAVWAGWGGEPSHALPTRWALAYLEEHPEIAALNADIPTRTMTQPGHDGKGYRWLCERCLNTVGMIVAGDLVVRCDNCGQPRKFYSARPRRADRNAP